MLGWSTSVFSLEYRECRRLLHGEGAWASRAETHINLPFPTCTHDSSMLSIINHVTLLFHVSLSKPRIQFREHGLHFTKRIPGLERGSATPQELCFLTEAPQRVRCNKTWFLCLLIQRHTHFSHYNLKCKNSRFEIIIPKLSILHALFSLNPQTQAVCSLEKFTL